MSDDADEFTTELLLNDVAVRVLRLAVKDALLHGVKGYPHYARNLRMLDVLEGPDEPDEERAS